VRLVFSNIFITELEGEATAPPHPIWLGPCLSNYHVLYLLGLSIHALAHLLTYSHSWLWAYKTGNISETVEDKAKVTINGLYKVVHGLSITAKMYDLE